jgi:hypothetical protein
MTLFLLTQGATSLAALTPLATVLGIADFPDPAVVCVHAHSVTELLIHPQSLTNRRACAG